MLVINSMIKESKYFSYVMKMFPDKELVMTRKDDEDFEIFVKDYAYGDAKVKDHYHVSLGNIEALHIGIVISRLN